MKKCTSCGNYCGNPEELCDKCYQSHGDLLNKSTVSQPNTIVSCEWLKENIGNVNLVILDCSPKSNKSGLASNLTDVFIPKSRYFDLANDFSDSSAELPNTFPSEDQFNINCQKLGINNDSVIVVYDNLGIYSSPRVWWMFQTMGHGNVHVLDGGLPAWVNKGLPITNELVTSFSKGNFTRHKNTERIKDYNFMKTYSPIGTCQVIDARSHGRFNGTDPEPREGLRSGSIPYSINIPFQNVLKEGQVKSKEELSTVFEMVLENKRPKVFTCGSGLTACIILLAAEHIGVNDLSVYDGSWTEWATKTQL